MKQLRKNARSTKTNQTIAKDVMNLPDTKGKRENLATLGLVEFTNKVYSDQIGRFPVNSSKGNKYILVLYEQDSNTILAEPLKNKL